MISTKCSNICSFERRYQTLRKDLALGPFHIIQRLSLNPSLYILSNPFQPGLMDRYPNDPQTPTLSPPTPSQLQMPSVLEAWRGEMFDRPPFKLRFLHPQ